ncbi:MAG: hypothetical protein AAGD47_16530 [Pseudomonadota bacterium]
MTSRTQLQTELDAVKAEIHTYPRPIAGCDAQFNHLLERRSALLAALADQPAQTERGT